MRTTIALEREAIEEQARAASDRLPIAPIALMRAIGEALPENAVVVDESISSGTGLRRFLSAQDPQGFFGVRGGGIGWGLPAAIGVKLAVPDRPVFALVGDGSAMYANQALWTAAHEDLAVTFVILNNRSYRILKQRMGALAGAPSGQNYFFGLDITEPPIDFVGLAQSLGVAATPATTLPEVTKALREGLASTAPRLVEVMLDTTI